MGKETYNLEDMLARITDENLHPEVDTGPPQGNEAWSDDSIPGSATASR